ncbi:MAG: biopolymer transporter ExbD [Gemmatimonadales bacterium]|jgi:biopolymer transport protein ExbD
MGMQVGSEGGVKSAPNVVPMIDIMLVLLIIFMIVTPVISAGFQAEMPMGKNVEPRAEDAQDIVLGMDRDGQFYLQFQDDPLEQPELRAVPDGRLGEVLTQIYENRTKDKILYFRADQELPFGQVQEAIEIARASGVRVLAAVAVQIQEETSTFGGGM